LDSKSFFGVDLVRKAEDEESFGTGLLLLLFLLNRCGVEGTANTLLLLPLPAKEVKSRIVLESEEDEEKEEVVEEEETEVIKLSSSNLRKREVGEI
jgi:hypothetical protein